MSERYYCDLCVNRLLDEKMTEKRKETPQDRYQRKTAFMFTVKLLRSTDAELVAWIESQPNRNGYIKSLIRADMEKHNK